MIFIWGLALDRRARKSRSRGRQLRFHPPASGGCRQMENEPGFVRIQFRVTLARETSLALPKVKIETHRSCAKRRVCRIGFCGRGGWTVPEASRRREVARRGALGYSRRPRKRRPGFSTAPLTVSGFTAFPSSLSPDETGVALPFCLVPTTPKVACPGRRGPLDLAE